MTIFTRTLLAGALAASCYGCVDTQTPIATQSGQNQAVAANKSDFNIPFEKMVLDNGLTVLLHQDNSDPIVALATVVHAGSNREKPGRTGFAHFFEHMSFNDSENVPMGANRKMIPELGGSRNGGTWNDGTIYYEVVPVDALEKLLWIDSDRFGYMINTVKEATLEREKQVVKNEKRQRVDNRAYGHTDHVIRKALYPADHPYNWTTIGDLKDLQNATLEDVRGFYQQFYVPSNATLVIAGNIDMNDIKVKVKKWFGEITAGKPPADLEPQVVTLEKDVKLYHLDNFAKLPELRLTFPTVQEYHQDAYALNALASILSDGKRAPLFTTLVKEQAVAPSVSAYQSSNEIAGTFTIRVRANAGTSLDKVHAAINKAMAKFETEGFADNDLARIKASQETDFYNNVTGVLDKALQLGIYNEFAGDPNYAGTDIANILAVSRKDVIRVYHRYIKNQPAVITSFVPKEQKSLVLSGSQQAKVIEEVIVAGAEKTFKESASDDFVKTATKLDRSEPPLGVQPPVQIPQTWRDQTPQGIKLLGIEHNELPLVNFILRVDGGQWLDKSDKTGTANLLAQLMNEGTANKNAAQLEDAIGLLGASIEVKAGRERISISGNTLAKHFDQTMALVNEMILAPRWDEATFERLKNRQLTRIKQSQGDPAAIASNVFKQQIYGEDHLGGQVFGGTASSVSNIKLADLKSWYQHNFSPKHATLHVVGDIKQQQVSQAVAKLDAKWRGGKIKFPTFNSPKSVSKPQVYFVDIPDAKQSVIYMGKAALKGGDPMYDQLDMANNRLGRDSSSRLTQVLRIEKGYTYGARSSITRNHYTGAFIARTQVRSNVTLESLDIMKDLVSNYSATFSEQDLITTKNLISKGYARRFETLDNLLDMLVDMSAYDLPDDFITNIQHQTETTQLNIFHQTVNKYMDEQQMIYVVVGDAKTQLTRVAALGYGEPIVLDIHGQPL
jgi:zinc protease